MSEFEDKLGAILGNPDAMAQIMSLAQNLGGGSEAPQPPPPSPAAAPPASPGTAPDLGALLGPLGDLDPQVLQNALQLFSQLSSTDDERAAFLLALKPFLKKERYAKVDRAIQIARLSRILRIAFRLFNGKGESNV